jgi:hypothetical protein
VHSWDESLPDGARAWRGADEASEIGDEPPYICLNRCE